MISYNSQFIDDLDISFVSKILKNKKSHKALLLKSSKKIFQNMLKSKYCVATNSGTSALYLAIKSLNLKK